MPQHKIYYKKITAQPDSFIEYLKKVWAYRSLIYTFAMRDLKVKYAQTILGLSWSIIQPATALIIYSFFFGYILGWKTDGLPFPIYVLSGLLGWNLFSYIVYQGSSSIQESSYTIKKVYFPKAILPISKSLIAIFECLVSFIMILPLLYLYDVNISTKLVFLPFVMLANIACGLIPVFWIGSFIHKKRDLIHLIPYLVGFGIWITPIFFTKETLPANVYSVLKYNPMTSIIDMWRWAMWSYGNFDFIWIYNTILILFLSILGLYIFSKKENTFTDNQ